MIADDSQSMREVVSITLQNAGYNVLVTSDGAEALNHLNGKLIDLVITDLHMPNMDGIKLIRSIRASSSYKFVPIIFLTTESQQTRKDEAKAAGATGWLVKPFVPEKLLLTIQKVIR